MISIFAYQRLDLLPTIFSLIGQKRWTIRWIIVFSVSYSGIGQILSIDNFKKKRMHDAAQVIFRPFLTFETLTIICAPQITWMKNDASKLFTKNPKWFVYLKCLIDKIEMWLLKKSFEIQHESTKDLCIDPLLQVTYYTIVLN